MKHSLLAALLFIAGALTAVAAESPTPRPDAIVKTLPAVPPAPTDSRIWPHDGSDLKPDAKTTFGKLDNGLRYVIRPAKQAASRASLRMYLRVGSLMETDAQRGLAHFLEHMAFNGSRQFPAGQTIEYLQRLGMSFAADTNANTSFDRTIYQLELPRANEELTDSGLKLFRDFLDGLTFGKQEIEKERGIILSELLARNTAAYRAAGPALRFSLPDSLVSERLPIGVADHIRCFTREQFVDFYEQWYTPGRTVIVAVGDFDVAMVERLICRHFADAQARRGEQPDPAIGNIAKGADVSAELFADADLESASIELSAVSRALPVHDSIAHQREELIQAMTAMMLNSRLEKLAAAEHAPFSSASFSHQRLFSFAEINSVLASCPANQWQTALSVLEQELRRAIQYGFTDAEFAEVKQKFDAIIKVLIDRAETRQPAELATEVINSLADETVFVNPADALPLLRQIFADLDKTACQQALQQIWTVAPVRIWMQGNFSADQADTPKMLAAFRASEAIPVTPPVDAQREGLAYTDFGPAGKLVSQTTDPQLDFTAAEFANHVRINVKHTDFEKNVANVSVRVGGGLLELPSDKPGLKMLATGTFIAGGLKAHSLFELNQILGKQAVSVRFAVGEDAFQLAGSCSSDLLELQFQLVTAYLIAPGYRPEAREQFLQALDGVYAQQQHTLEGALGSDGPVYAFLRGGDPRFAVPARDAMHQLTMHDLQAWLAGPLRSGYLEVTVVGDVNVQQVLAAAAKTLGALPERAAAKPTFAEQRKVMFPTQKDHQIEIATTTPRAAAIVCWPTAGGCNIPLSRRASALAMILNERLRVKVREELGATYTPEVFSYTSDAFPDFGYFAAVLSVDPARVTEISPIVVAIGDELSKAAINDDEFERTMKPILASLENRDNAYWLNTLEDCQEHPESLAAARTRQSDWGAITKADLENLAKQLLPAGQATTIAIVPAAAK